MHKAIQYIIKGMNRDLSISRAQSEFSFENKNIRITARDKNTLLSITNEKGNKEIPLDLEIDGTLLGHCVINQYLVLFSKGEQDNIYKIEYKDKSYKGILLYTGNLGFSTENPIETIGIYENESIIKVYWVDGLNQPRVINIVDKNMSNWDRHSFDFIPIMDFNEEISIERQIVASGTFAPGTIQYAFTYFSPNRQESNIFYTSPLYYISFNNRGAGPEDKVGNSFTINAEKLDTSFEYVRIYSIHRTSIDATPEVKRVVDLPLVSKDYFLLNNTIDVESIEFQYKDDEESLFIYDGDNYINIESLPYEDTQSGKDEIRNYSLTVNEEYTIFGTIRYPSETKGIKFYTTKDIIISRIYRYSGETYYTISSTNMIYGDLLRLKNNYTSYTDNGTGGDSIDPTLLLYVGGEDISALTMTHKDNTLFLGNLKLRRELVSEDIIKSLKENKASFNSKKWLSTPSPKGYYPYENQLKQNSNDIKIFKYLEYYRLGVQLQHSNGKWSEPIWIDDVQNTIEPITNYMYHADFSTGVPSFVIGINSISKMLGQGYSRIRPVIVYPSMTDRECICQGVLCPTVYNVNDRYNNSPFSQSSWFIRPNAPFDIKNVMDGADWVDRDDPNKFSINSRKGIISNSRMTITPEGQSPIMMDMVKLGAWAEFRHNYPIPSNSQRNAEIQCIYNPPESPYLLNSRDEESLNRWAAYHSENFYVDQSIVTLHSPDIEFNTDIRSIDTSGLKLRIVGFVPLTSFVGDIDIQTSTPPNNFLNSQEAPKGFNKQSLKVENLSRFGWKSMLSGPFWFDEVSDYKDKKNDKKLTTAFVVYPWHRNGSLNNKKWADENGTRPAMLDKKKMSNIKYSYNSYYLYKKDIWEAYKEGEKESTGISGISVFDSNELTLSRIPAPLNSDLEDINYYGNIDKVITSGKDDGYPIMTSGVQNENSNSYLLFVSDYYQIENDVTDQVTGTDPVRMKYKSTPHAIMALNYTDDGNQKVLPTIYETVGVTQLPVNSARYASWVEAPFWDRKRGGFTVVQDILNIKIPQVSPFGSGTDFGFLWLGELYNDEVVNRFGGQTEEAFENNQWLPCGEPISLRKENTNPKDNIVIEWMEGDTYYQRYDHIKTYPFTLEDQNAVTEIVSFMCETRVNIDGRYDKNRGQTSNLAITPENFNKLNEVYSQSNNFFNYRGLNRDRFNLDNFPNSITWTKEKILGELIDTWTNITMASTLDLDGDKGEVTSLNTFNNEIYAFQPRGLSNILFNSRVQIPTSDNVPIEISTGMKVGGKRYINNSIGCTNKWSIKETPNGIYFIDGITDSIYLLNQGLTSLSNNLGFKEWLTNNNNMNIWNPETFNSFITHYDKINNDVYFINKDYCLCYSEILGQFTSFMSYEETPLMVNLEDNFLSFKNNKLWEQNTGEYNMFFNEYKPYYMTYRVNPDGVTDKIFNNIEFRSDTFDRDILIDDTFDTLEVWNEYQRGNSKLEYSINKPSSLKKKFRIWRANIPRDSINKRDRIRNPWIYIKLMKDSPNTFRTEFHNLIVYYFD